MFKNVLIISLLYLLAGCSSIRFFELKSKHTELTQQTAAVELLDLSTKSTAELHNHCLSIDNRTDLGNTLLARCTKALLGQPDLSPQLQKYALKQHNEALLNLVKLTGNNNPILSVEINETPPFIVVESIKAKENALTPNVFGELGVAVVLREDNTLSGLYKYYPAEGLYTSKTLILQSVTNKNGLIKISLSATDKKYESLGRNDYSLKYSPGAAFLALIESATINDFSWLGFTNASRAEKRRGIFSIGEFSKHKIPIIMTHGLNSDPLIWRNLTMAILNNQALSDCYQVWHVYYPSGPPPFFNAMRIRKQLNEFITALNSPTLFSEGVLVGHSMGGIISRTLSTASKDKLWDITFTDSYDSLAFDGSSEVKDIFVFEPVFENATVFFLDTPHRGSTVANSVIGSIGSAFVTLPDSFKNIFKRFIDRVGIDKITNPMQPFLADHGPNSVQVLRPGHPLMQELVSLPLSGTSYSIIGSNSTLHCESDIECNKISDGVVTYSSAYIEDAKETIIVESSHNSFKNPDAISFIVKALTQALSKGK